MKAPAGAPEPASASSPKPGSAIPTLEERSFSLRSASGKRVYPRVALPIKVEIDGEPYRASDWSLGGLCLESSSLALAVGDVRQARLAFSLPGFTATINATLKVVWRSGSQCGVRYIDISTETARIISDLVDLYLTGKVLDLGGLAAEGRGAAEDLPGQGASWIDSGFDLLRRARTALLLATCFVLLAVVALYVISSRLTVYSDYAAVAGISEVLRAPEAGFLRGKPLELGTDVRAGEPMVELTPAVPPQVRMDIKQKVRVLQVQIAEQQANLDAAQRGFQNFIATAQTNLDTATLERRTLEEIVAAHQRNLARFDALAQEGWISHIVADQELIALLSDQRNLDEAVSTEATARRAVDDANDGRFSSDGRSTQLSPANIQYMLAGLQAQRDALLAQAKELEAPLTITAPCNCSVTSVESPPNSFVAAGAQIAGLTEASSGRSQVDALVTNNRLAFLAVGDRVSVYMTDRRADVGGRIVSINHSPANTGRAGLPDSLRTLADYGLVTIDLDRDVQNARVGVPALLSAHVSIDAFLRDIPGFNWMFGRRDSASET